MINEEFSTTPSSRCKDKKPIAVSDEKDPLSGSNPIGNESPNQVQPQSHRRDVKNEENSRRRRRRFRSMKNEATPQMKQGPDPATISNQRIVMDDRDSSSNLEGQWRANDFLDPIPIRVDGDGSGTGSLSDQASRPVQPRIVTSPVQSPVYDSSVPFGGSTVAQGFDSFDNDYYYDCLASIGGCIDYKTWAAAKRSEFDKDNGCERCSQRLERSDDDDPSSYERIGRESKSKAARDATISQRPASSASTGTASPLGIGRGRPRIVSNADVMPGLVKMNGGGSRSNVKNSSGFEPSSTMSGGITSGSGMSRGMMVAFLIFALVTSANGIRSTTTGRMSIRPDMYLRGKVIDEEAKTTSNDDGTTDLPWWAVLLISIIVCIVIILTFVLVYFLVGARNRNHRRRAINKSPSPSSAKTARQVTHENACCNCACHDPHNPMQEPVVCACLEFLEQLEAGCPMQPPLFHNNVNYPFGPAFQKKQTHPG